MNKEMLSGMFYGLVSVLAVVLVTSFIISILLKFTSLTEASFTITTLVISFLALFIGGLVSGTKGRQRGLAIGAGTGLLYGIVVFLVQYLGFETGFSMEQYLYFAAYIVVAAFGGMIGVNLISKRIRT